MNGSYKFQIGKNGVTEGVINSIALGLKTHKSVRISLLKSTERNRKIVLEFAEKIKKDITEKTGKEYRYRIIGFTIILRR